MSALGTLLGVCFATCMMLLVAGHGASSARAAEGVEQEIRARIEQVQSGQQLRIDGALISAVAFILTFYQQREFRPAWTDQANVTTLLAAVAGSEEHGLRPSDFHAQALEAAQSRMAEGQTHPAGAAG